MYGARRSTSRRVGVLKAPLSASILLAVGENGAEVGHDRGVAAVVVVLRLILERGAQPRPELPIAEEPVDDRGRAPVRRLALEVRGESLGVGPAVARLVTAHAGDGTGLGPAPVPEEL